MSKQTTAAKTSTGQCACGASNFTVTGPPVMRLFCHCTICQEFNNAPFADISVYTAGKVNLPDDNPVAFNTYKKPPAVQRGKCSKCGEPAIEFFHMPLVPDMVLIPSENIAKTVDLPEPKFHMFYHRRVADANDSLPKYSGPMSSHLGSAKIFIASLMAR